MTKYLLVLGMTSAMTLAGVLMWKAEATPIWRGHQLRSRVIKSYDSGAKGGMHVRHAPLPAGTKWSCTANCGPDGSPQACICRPC